MNDLLLGNCEQMILIHSFRSSNLVCLISNCFHISLHYNFSEQFSGQKLFKSKVENQQAIMSYGGAALQKKPVNKDAISFTTLILCFLSVC